jgi:hypothetical protein
LQALTTCYTCATEVLQIIVKDFTSIGVLRYGQDSTIIMSAYAAVFLLKLLRSSPALAELHDGVTEQIYGVIRRAAEAYQSSPILPEDSMKPNTHARFLQMLVSADQERVRHEQRAAERARAEAVAQAAAAAISAAAANESSLSPALNGPMHGGPPHAPQAPQQQQAQQPYNMYPSYAQQPPQHQPPPQPSAPPQAQYATPAAPPPPPQPQGYPPQSYPMMQTTQHPPQQPARPGMDNHYSHSLSKMASGYYSGGSDSDTSYWRT